MLSILKTVNLLLPTPAFQGVSGGTEACGESDHRGLNGDIKIGPPFFFFDGCGPFLADLLES